MEEHYWYFAHIENNIVDVVYIFDPKYIPNVYDEYSAKQYLSSISGKPIDSFINCYVGGIVKGIYPEPGYRYNEEQDVFSEN